MDNNEARLRVLSLYKAWFRQIPFMVEEFDIPINNKMAQDTLKAKFKANSHIKDVRVIDMLVIKVCNYFIIIFIRDYLQITFQGQHDLQEVVEKWTQGPHIMSKHFKESIEEKPKDFLSKFLQGQE